ncbi:MAG: sulfatase-like hydrolase/transferase [Bacillota bacterium]|nr:sulfatase-like hydrolase/transferase [Bacillota bacterium]
MLHSFKKMEKQGEGKADGLSFAACVLRGRVYSREGGPLSFLYLLPLVLAYLCLDLTLRFTYRGMGIVGVKYLPASLFTLGWVLVLAGFVLLLPRKVKWLGRGLPVGIFVALCLTHSAFMEIFSRFFSFSDLTYSGVGGFVKADYIRFQPLVLTAAAAAVLLVLLSGRMERAAPAAITKRTLLLSLLLMAAGGVIVAAVHFLCFPKMDTVMWKNTGEDGENAAYQNYINTTNALMVSGLFQYTARDLFIQVAPAGSMTGEERQLVEDYVAEYEAARTENDYTGLLAGKNVILVQLEAIDTWMLSEAYMPNLWNLKQESLSFSNHYTPTYIAAGTFNTEFMVNTGLLPATGGLPTSVYLRDAYPYSLPSLFTQAGYTARSFHNSEGAVYDREAIHLNLGYESYTSGWEMGMESISLDRYLINGFEDMVAGEPFYSFVITFSAHGMYGEDNPIYQANAQAAQAVAQRTEDNYVYAVAGAIETDLFIGELMDKLTESGHLEDTVLIFYADHHNKYIMDNDLEMELKGVDQLNLLEHTDFFIWSQDLPAGQVDKVTGSLDVLPTVANLFGLDTTGAFLAGHDGLGDQGGYVFFSDGSWYDGQTYWAVGSDAGDPQRSSQIARITALSNLVLSGDYYGEK